MAAGARDSALIPKAIPLTGQYLTAVDPMTIGENFKDLSNFRYTDTGLKPVQGMTKFNSSVMNATYLKPRSAYHLNKFQPSESHLLVQAWNTGLTASQILTNTTAIGSAGNFSATALYTESSGASRGIWATGPDGTAIYCNGKESLIYGGTESRVAAFINYNSNGTFFYDFTEQVNDLLTTPGHVATLAVGASAGIDADVSLLLHGNGTDGSTTITDSSTASPKTVTAHNNAQIDTSRSKFDGASIQFDGTNDYLTTPDDAGFDFSGGNFSIDFWINLTTNPSAGNRYTIYYQETDANNYMELYVKQSGFDAYLGVKFVAAGVTVLDFSQAGYLYGAGAWRHVELTEDGDTWYWFIDGNLVTSGTDTTRAANYTGVVYIGSDASINNDLNGWLDEFRVSKTTRHTASFTVPTSAYGASNVTTCYVGAMTALSGLKPYVGTANTASSTLAISYWDGSNWTAVSGLSDGTSVGGKSLAQTGTITFTSTDGLASRLVINELSLYWYRLEWTANVDATTTITQLTVRYAMQTIKDIWDGTDRPVTAFLRYSGSTYRDYSPHVFKSDYDSGNTATYAALGGLATSTDFLIAGFSERMEAIKLYFVEDKINAVANTSVTVAYWNGTAWTNVTGLHDDTMIGNIAFAKSGVLSWTPPSIGSELKYEGFGQITKAKVQKAKVIVNPETGTTTTVPEKPVVRVKKALQKDLPSIYFYKISLNKNLSADIRLDYVAGIPAQQNPSTYRGCFASNERVFLFDDVNGKRNRLLSCNLHTPYVWNGDDSIDEEIGDDRPLTGGACLDLMGQNGPIQIHLVTKHDQTFLLGGNSPDTLTVNIFADGVGCVAPATMCTGTMGGEQEPGRQFAIWESGDGIYQSWGDHPQCISRQIDNLWRDGLLEKTMIPNHSAFFDPLHHEWHWCYASSGSTTLDKELVYDVWRKKWFPVTRSAALQCGVVAHDTNQTVYTYGGIETGYLEQLESGMTFDGTAITSMFETGDLILYAQGGLLTECEVKRTQLMGVSKTTTTNLIQGSYYGDTSTTPVTFTLSPTRTGYRVFDGMDTSKLGSHILHRWKFSLTTSNETYGFEPLSLTCYYQVTRQHLNSEGA